MKKMYSLSSYDDELQKTTNYGLLSFKDLVSNNYISENEELLIKSLSDLDQVNITYASERFQKIIICYED